MSFILSLVVITGLVMGLYYMVSKYVKSSDVDKIKARLTGVGKNKKKAKGSLVESSVVRGIEAPKNRFAQMLVEKYSWVPSSACFSNRRA